MKGKVSTIYLTHKNRFIRFGFEWFSSFCKKFDCDVIVVNNEQLSPQEELVQDLIAIIHAFFSEFMDFENIKRS